MDLLVVDHDIDIIVGKISIRKYGLMEKLERQCWTYVDGLIQEREASSATELARHSNLVEVTGVPHLIHTTFSKDLYFNREDIQEQLDVELR